MSIFLNSFFYYFINFSILVLLLSIKFLDKNFFKFLYENKSKITILFSFFILFSLPFLFQINFGESDYSERIGVFEIDSEKKIYLLKYYFMNLLRIVFLLLFIFSL